MPFPIKALARQKAATVVLATALPLALAVGAIASALDRHQWPWFLWILAVLLPAGMAVTYARLAIEIDARRWNRGFICIKSPRTTVYLYRMMPGALEAMRELADQHPSIKFQP
jgi:hypothetical protein